MTALQETAVHETATGTRRVVVVGNGMAGARLTSEVRLRDPDGERVHLTVLGAEPEAAYNRVLLSSLLARTAAEASLALGPADDVAGLDLHLGTPAARIDRAAQVVEDADGTHHPYDDLVLATGSTAWIPPVPGLTDDAGGLVAGAVAFRTLADCRAIDAAADASRGVVVVGGGLLGVEAARGLAGRGVPVTLVHPGGHLMERQLDRGAGLLVARTLRRLGVDVRVGSRAARVERDGAGRVAALHLADGEVLPTPLLVVATGVRPQTTLARDAGLAVERGVVVDDELRSVSDRRVRAIGECAEHAGRVHGLVAPAWEQAEVLADLLVGSRLARYRGSSTVTRLKADDVDLVALGECADVLGPLDLDASDDGLPDTPGAPEVVQFSDPVRGTYKKLVVRDDRLVGAILLGDSPTIGRLVQLFDAGDPVPADRTSLLFGPRAGERDTVDPTLLPDRTVVCTCNRVTKGDVVACWQRGGRSVGDVAAGTRATTGCGTCRDTVGGLLEWLASVDPPQPAEPAPLEQLAEPARLEQPAQPPVPSACSTCSTCSHDRVPA